MKNFLKIFPAFLLFFCVTLFPQEKFDYSNDPGYVDFGDLSKYEEGNNVTEVLVEKNLLRMVANATRNSDTALYDLLSGLKLVKVNSFRTDEKNKEDLYKKMDEINKKLTSKDWDRIVHVRSGDEYTNVFIKSSDSGNDIYGLVVTTYDGNGESSFVNIVGRINLETIGRLGGKFDIPSLSELNKRKH